MSKTSKLILSSLILIGIAGLILITAPWKDDSQVLVSGTVKTNRVDVNLRYGGRVAEVYAAEGQAINKGDLLIRLEDDILIAQYHQAEAELSQATAEYNLMKSQPLSEQRQALITNTELDRLYAQQTLDSLFNNSRIEGAKAKKRLEESERALEDILNSTIRQTQAKEKIASAQKALDSAKRNYLILSTPPSQAVIDGAYARLKLAESVLEKTREDLEWARDKLQGNMGPDIPKELYITEYKSGFRQTVQALEMKLSQDTLAYEHALQEYQRLLEPPDPIELALSEAALALAEAKLEQAQREYLRVMDGPTKAEIDLLEAQIQAARREYTKHLNGPNPDELAKAKARVKQEEAKLKLADGNTIHEQLEVARVRVETARESLRIIKARLDEKVVSAPCNCIVLDQNVEVGEVVKPGKVAFTLLKLNQHTVVMFFPEEYYHDINLNEIYPIQVDAFPNRYFDAKIIQKSNKNDFIPRNTREPNNPTQYVFLVKFVIIDPEGILKSGMIAHLQTNIKANHQE